MLTVRRSDMPTVLPRVWLLTCHARVTVTADPSFDPEDSCHSCQRPAASYGSQATTLQYGLTRAQLGLRSRRLVLGLSLFSGRARSDSTTIYTLCIMNACR